MAQYTGNQKFDIRDVHQVARRYNQLWREYSNFPQEGRPSDYDLWRHGKPAISTEGTISDGEARLIFVFRDYTQADAEQWVRRYIRDNKVPYTSFNMTHGDVPLNDFYAPGEEMPTYTRVVLKFEMHPDYRDPISLRNR